MGGRRGRLISATDRKKAISLIREAVDNGARQEKACEEIGISLRTLQRWRSDSSPNEDQRPISKKKVPKNRLTKKEREEILKVVNQPEYKNLSPNEIVPLLADKGIYLASESTIYRILREEKQLKHRGNTKKPQNRPISTHYATGPNQVWMWDITYLKGPIKGIYYYLYLILDLFSRKVVGWEIWSEQSAQHASELVKRAVLAENILLHKKPLVLHSDNGSPMKGATLLETLYQLGITPSNSRPRVSNDNPYAESIFKTFKYCPGYPDKGFETIKQARTWTLQFINWYNYEHLHSGIKYLTPHQRHSGLSNKILKKRIKVYEQAQLKHPERWSRNIRNWSVENIVWLNPEKSSILEKEETKSS
ncbi:IS3 family transposase [Mycoplasmatota bacterium]|nr:IS3 family transposase [Mycoplasmatota bacterium]